MKCNALTWDFEQVIDFIGTGWRRMLVLITVILPDIESDVVSKQYTSNKYLLYKCDTPDQLIVKCMYSLRGN